MFILNTGVLLELEIHLPDNDFLLYLKMMKKIFPILILFLPFFVLDAGLVPCGGVGQPSCQICHLFVLANNVIEFFLFTILPILIPLMIIAGGAWMIMGYVSPEKGPDNIKKAKKMIESVIIGTIIVYTAWIIVNTFFQVLGVLEWQGFERDGLWEITDCPGVD